MTNSLCSFIDSQGRRVAEVAIRDFENEWYYGQLVGDMIPDEARRDLAWYDEVVSNQLLSHLDDALQAVERHGLSVRLADETCHRVYSLHIDRSGETTFRITPVPPPSTSRLDSTTVLG